MSPLIRGLLRAEAYDHRVTAFQVLETHISWVILTGDYAYKLKKPVDLGFVDFTTLERRQHFCDEEIRLNRRLISELYLGVRPIYGSTDQPTFVGSGTPIDFAVQMRQFDQSALLPEVLKRGELHPWQIDRLATTIAEFQHHAATADESSTYGTPDAVRAPVRANFEHLESSPFTAERQAALTALDAWCDSEFERLRHWFAQRRSAGRIREGHGDLHLGNMVLWDDIVRPFDCLEFNPGLRWIDVISEIAFLVMDLQERGRPDLAYRLLNRWLEETGDYDGLTGWRWYFMYRAMVRAKVAALRLHQTDLSAQETASKQQELAAYLDLARASTAVRSCPILVMHGLSGSGKSHVAQWICERFRAIRLRSDVERKRLFGQWGTPRKTPATGDLYASDVTQRLYQETLAGLIPGILAAGFAVVVDAACLKRWQRSVFSDLSIKLGVNCRLIDVQAAPDTLRRRLQDRQFTGADPSDADLAVLERQVTEREPLTADEPAIAVDTDSSAWQATLERELAGC